MSNQRRKFLAKVTMLIAGIGIGLSTIPFFRSWRPNAKSDINADTFEFPKLEPGQIVSLTPSWHAQIYVLRRTPEMIEGLKHFQGLADPDSNDSIQPEQAKNAHRSQHPEYLVVESQCTHLGCNVAYSPRGTYKHDESAEKYGCFFCPCHGSLFDLAGRVLQGMPAQTNMVVPKHEFLSPTKVRIKHGRASA